MGYYSDVVLVLSKKAAQVLRERIEKAEAEAEEGADCDWQVDFTDKYLKTDGAELYYWESIKWYTAFPEVKWLEDFIDSLDGTDFLFIRIGESYEDIEHDGMFWDNPFTVNIARKITFNG